MLTVQDNIDLPPIPEELCQRALDIVSGEGFDRIVYRSGENYFYIRAVDEAIEQWVRENITSQYYKVGVQHTTGDLYPHVDGPDMEHKIRSYVLLYTIETGGKDGVDPDTVSYKTPDGVAFNEKLVVRHLLFRKNPSRTKPGLEEVKRVKFKKGTWGLLNTQNAHSVEGVKGLRCMVSVSFQDGNEPDFIRKLVDAQR